MSGPKSGSEVKRDDKQTVEERAENLEIIKDFFLIVLGISLGYFGSVAVSRPSVVGIGVLITAVEVEVTHFPILPNLHQFDTVTRATGFLILLPVSVIIYPLILSRYNRWLRTQANVSLMRELVRLFFLLFWPIAAFWIFDPETFLSESGQITARLIGVFYVLFNLGFFFYTTRSVRRGLLR